MNEVELKDIREIVDGIKNEIYDLERKKRTLEIAILRLKIQKPKDTRIKFVADVPEVDVPKVEKTDLQVKISKLHSLVGDFDQVINLAFVGKELRERAEGKSCL